MNDELNKLRLMCQGMRELLVNIYDHEDELPPVIKEWDDYIDENWEW
jgi:hypothetical protein